MGNIFGLKKKPDLFVYKLENKPQQQAINNICADKNYVIIHIYETGTLMISIKQNDIDYLQDPIYLIETNGQVTKTSHPSYFMQTDRQIDIQDPTYYIDMVDRPTKVERPMITSDMYTSSSSHWFECEIQQRGTNYFTVGNEYIDTETVHQCSFGPGESSISTISHVTYGGIIHIQEIHENRNRDIKTQVNINIWSRLIDENVKKEMLPLDPPIYREVKTILENKLVKNVAGLILEYIS